MLVTTSNGLLIDVMENRDGGGGDDLRQAASAALLVAQYDEPDAMGHGTMKIRPEDILVQDDDDDDLGVHTLGREQLPFSTRTGLGLRDSIFSSDHILSKMSDFGRRPRTPGSQLMSINTSPKMTGQLHLQFDQLVSSAERVPTTFELKGPDLTMPSPVSPERISKSKTHLGTPPSHRFGPDSSPFSYQLDKLHPSPMGTYDTHDGYQLAALSPPLGSGMSYLMGGKSMPSSPNGLEHTLRAYNTPMSPDLSFAAAPADVIVEAAPKAATPPSGKRRNMRISDVPGISVIKPDVQLYGPLPTGAFICDHPGCKARPFQTQYLLNSHQNVHSTSRPHLCPVAGCKRAQPGQGFKRKNEMIRHSLVHSSPGYVCPFCPDREHRYPRPDNLQRHVRVHHQDKDKDDPLLRDVLSLRPEGESKSRRKRTVPAILHMPQMEPNHDKLARGMSV